MIYKKLMINKTAFANSLATITGIFYLAFYILRRFFPDWFTFLFNAQFIGADVASLIPGEFAFNRFIGALAAVVIPAWIIGYLWALFYNRFTKK